MRKSGRFFAVLALTAGTALSIATPAVTATAATPTTAPAAPHPGHVFLIMEENNGFQDVIGNKAAPNLNYLANTFGLETNFYGVNQFSSEVNYAALLGGSPYNVTSDDAYWKNKVVGKPSLITQMDHAKVSWKAYLQSLPYAGYQGICYPAKCNGAPDADPLYVSKHDAIQNFTESWNQADWSRQVPIGQLTTDLRKGNVPQFSYVVPDECHDMHGDPPYCLDSGNIGDPQNQHLVSVGDAYLGQLVAQITHASFWAKSNNAIIITFDSGDNNKGCCDANPGGGQVATIVVTSHGPRHATDAAPANHYSTLSTLEHVFGLGCLANACDTANVQPYDSLLADTGSKAIATKVLPQLNWPTPTPSQPAEPLSETTATPSSGGWTVQQTQRLGGADNSLGGIAGSSPTDIWAVGNYLPDAPGSNVDATGSFAEHYDGTKWTVVRTPNAGPNYNSLFSVGAAGGEAWAVGTHLNAAFKDRALVEVWNGSSWHIANVPQPGTQRDILSGASALSKNDVWVVGDQQGANDRFETLAEHWNGQNWSVVRTPNPGSTGNHLYAVDAVGPDNVWAVGQQNGTQVPDQALVEHWNGQKWSVVNLPASESGSVLLDGVTVSGGQVWAVGESDTPDGGGKALVEHYADGKWTTPALPETPAGNWANLYGVAVSGDSVWAVGTYVDPASDTNRALVLQGTGGTWTVNNAPDPGSGNNIPGAITAIGGNAWMAGTYTNGGSRMALIEQR
ncbi:MAG TPA: alkaline phosphatase family protein [Trebonia sp.]